ncbi:RICIN domain-containing protein [Chitinophaga filiformis]|uniref:Uncharacterized protein n=1 Tax=Chitinophaga filiformis TaxID=104663 RepID=A0A1G7RIC1_CHIFI|nr:RICIN domain-containing protein [Chitinophaga filiformis]SDG10395.1 hypothetical protein SAMN04488121_103474 [Chitinophaga filiformis]
MTTVSDHIAYALAAAGSGGLQSGKVLEIGAQSTAPGARVVQYTDNGGDHQLRTFRHI